MQAIEQIRELFEIAPNTSYSAMKLAEIHEKATSISSLREVLAHIDKLEAENERLKKDYQHACNLVADMHAAAVGDVTGPKVGVVEDVAAVRAENEQLRKDAERYRTALKAMTQTEYCDCGCPKAEKPILLMPSHYYALALEALKGTP